MKRRRVLIGFVAVGTLVVVWLTFWGRSGVEYQGASVETWALRAASTNQAIQAQAQAAFRTIGTNAIPELLGLLRAQDSRALGELGYRSTKWPGHWGQLLRKILPARKSYLLRESAARAMGFVGPPAHTAISALISAMHDPIGRVRWEAADAIGHIGGTEAVNSLIATLSDKDPATGQAAAYALGQIGPPAASSIPALVNTLSDQRLGPISVYSLGQIGTASLAAAYELQATSNETARVAAAHIIGELLRASASNATVRFPSVEHMSSESASPGLVSNLIRGLKDKSAHVRLETAREMFLAGPAVVSATAALTRATNDSSAAVRTMVLQALRAMKTNSPSDITQP